MKKRNQRVTKGALNPRTRKSAPGKKAKGKIKDRESEQGGGKLTEMKEESLGGMLPNGSQSQTNLLIS